MKDFGFVRPLTSNRFAFKLWNESDAPIEIAAVTPSCKCTTTNDLAGTTIAPGEYAELGAQLDAGAAIGIKGASIKILIDGYTRVLTVSLRAEVTQILRIVPGYINAIGGENEQGRLVIESTDGRPFRICSLHGLPVMGATDAGTGAGGEPQTRHIIAYDLTEFAPGTIPRYMVIETDHPDCPAADVLVRHDTVKFGGGVRGVQDMRGSFGRIAPGESAIMSVRFKEPTGEAAQPIEFVSITAESPDVSVELLEPERDSETGIMEARFKLTPREGFVGLIATRVFLHTATRKQEFLAYGRVAPDAACVKSAE